MLNKLSNNGNKLLLGKKREIKKTIFLPFQVKHNLTMGLLDDCFNHNLVLSLINNLNNNNNTNNNKSNKEKKEKNSEREKNENNLKEDEKNINNNISKEKSFNNEINTKQNKLEEINDLLVEISEINSEIELFAMERRKRRMMKLIEKMAENIDDNSINIDELTDILFFGHKLNKNE